MTFGENLRGFIGELSLHFIWVYILKRNQILTLLRNFEFLPKACSVNLTGAIGTFNSRKDADIHYCTWRITVSPVLQIIIKFTNFSLQNAGNDSLLVYDGEDASKKVLGEFYNGQLPPKEGICSSSNHMFVVFKSNNHTKDSGFFASYYTFNKSRK